jgi:steroid delta-isomerase-like uncharacterized protein
MKNHLLTPTLSPFETLGLAGIMLILGLFVVSDVRVALAESGADPKALVEQSLEVWNKGNMALVDELYTPEFKLHLVDQINGEREGAEAFKEYVDFLRTAYPDMKLAPEEVIVSDDKVIMRMNFTGTNTGPRGDVPPTGKNVQVSGVMISRIDDGKIAEEWLYVNMASVFRQLGFTITPPSQEK